MIKVYIGEEQLDMLRVPIYVVQEFAGDYNNPPRRLVLHYNNDKYDSISWDEGDPGTVIKPTFTLPIEAAHALLEALVRKYEGASDMHTVRQQDLLHERERVDTITDAVIGMAKALATPPAVSPISYRERR